MTRWLSSLREHPRSALGTGFGLGLLVGVGMLFGALATLSVNRDVSFAFPETALHASATDSGESFAIATGDVDDGVEGAFFLDFNTGELKCLVMNPRTGQIGGLFEYNVIRDLGMDPGRKNVKYLMVTGRAELRSGGGGFRPAYSLVYILDGSTGKFAVYGIPWNRNATATNRLQTGKLIPVFKGSMRNFETREP